MYTAEEVGQTIDSLHSLVSSDIQAEFEKYTNQTVLFIVQMFLQAEAQGTHINIDPSVLDDQQLLNIVKQYAISAENRDVGKTKLASMSSDIDISLVTKNKELQTTVDSLQSHMAKLQEQLKASAREVSTQEETIARLTKEKETLQKTNEALEADLSRSASENNTQQLTDQLTAMRSLVAAMEESHAREMADMKQKLDTARAELTSKIHATPQYQQLQRMVQDKNKLLKELRLELRAYEEKSPTAE